MTYEMALLHFSKVTKALEEMLSYFPDEETINDLKPTRGLGYRSYPCDKNGSCGVRDNKLMEWIEILKEAKGE